MPDTPDARAAQALELSYALDIPGVPFQRSAAADLLRALAADVTQLSCGVVELKGRWEMAEAQRDALITAICGYPDHPEMVISTDDALRAAKQWRSDHNADIDRASRLEARLSVALKGLEAVHSLIEQSGGVYDLHLNGDPAQWSELRQGGRFEDWLRDFDAALDAVGDGNRPEIPDSSGMPGNDHSPDAGEMVYEPYPGAFDGIIGAAAEQPIRDLVSRFAAALLEKLIAAETKYGWRNGWLRDDWADKCRSEMRRHIEKGDPRDVAAYCAFLWHHGWSTAEEIARNANCPGDPVPCLACKGTGTVPRGPRLCTTCDHGTTGTCAKNHGPATAYKGCSDWAANTGEAVTHG